MRKTLIFNLVLILVVIVFAIQNYEPVSVKLFLWPVNVSPALLVVIVLLIGVLLGIIASSAEASKKKKKKTETDSKAEKSETEKV